MVGRSTPRAPRPATDSAGRRWPSVDEEPPRGLRYDPTFGDVVMIGSDVVALVSLNIDIDYPALLLSEGYTCGRTISPTEVTVDLCDDRELDVLGFGSTPRLPDSSRLVVSHDGGAFVAVDAPFPDSTAPEPALAVAQDRFVMTNAEGELTAASTDGDEWVSLPQVARPVEVHAAKVTRDGTAVGFGTLRLDGRPVLVRTDEGDTASVDLSALVGEVEGPFEARVATGADRFAVHVEASVNSWLFVSADGLSWEVIDLAFRVEDATLHVGASHAVLTWVDAGGEPQVRSVRHGAE